MEVEPPPVPSDPDGSRNTFRQAASSRKRHVKSDEPATESGKKSGLNPPQASVQTMCTHPSFAEGPKGYSRDDKGRSRTHLQASIRALKFGLFLHQNKFTHIVKDGVKSVGRNRVSVEFSNAQAANDFLSNQILTLTKYKAAIPIFNITRMGLVRGVPIDWSVEDFVESLELPIGCGEVLKARRLNRKNIIKGITEWVPTQSTIIRSPRLRTPLAKGYNKQAHDAIINLPPSSLPNGCALGNSQPDFL
ncbi:unnamed protein product [Leptidea sinapis]|uniref:Uncharacterized protein n=1 Tax=Leptidea sinapis TaxID=189913 RepID=A0A5E4QKG4_9NEOP|nr:unnamed protein product [Leptidea sinapis]